MHKQIVHKHYYTMYWIVKRWCQKLINLTNNFNGRTYMLFFLLFVHICLCIVCAQELVIDLVPIPLGLKEYHYMKCTTKITNTPLPFVYSLQKLMILHAHISKSQIHWLKHKQNSYWCRTRMDEGLMGNKRRIIGDKST